MAAINDIPGASDALNTIVQALGKWQALPDRLLKLAQQAAAVQTAGVSAQNAGVVGAMSAVQNQLAALQQTVQGSMTKIGVVTSFIAGVQAGTADINGSIIADAVSLAVTITTGLANADAQQAQIESAAAKVLTPAQAASIGIGSVVPGGASATKWLAYAVAAFIGYKVLKGGRRP